jgi:integrase
MARRGPRPAVRWWAKNGGGFYYKRQLLVRCDQDDGPKGPNFLAAMEEMKKIDRQELCKGTDSFALSALLNAYRKFLTTEGRKASLNNVTYFLKPFSDLHGTMAVGLLCGHHVRDWLDGAVTWGSSSKRLAVKMLSAALNWGVKDGLIKANPLKGRMPLPKDTPRGREARLPQEFISLLVDNANDEFRKLLVMWRDTGARPEEIEQAEAFNYIGGRIVYRWNATQGHVHKQAKRGQEKDRVIYLTPPLRRIMEEEIDRRPRGKLFLTQRGAEWNKQTRLDNWEALLAKQPVAKYMKKHGLKRKHIVPYCLRHTWLSEWIDAGRSIKVAADLCGTSVAMIEKHYGHPDEGRLEAMYMEFMSGEPDGK